MAKHKTVVVEVQPKSMRQQTLFNFERRENAVNELYMQVVSARDSLEADLEGYAKAIRERLAAVRAIVKGK